ncbi:hypothetical protein DL93DRAFT_2227600 [Clavulina sp. PMI_390]|nr:hypothetical protein DL93DRAFT_2227600 [Clavulina sp. PMI_390]
MVVQIKPIGASFTDGDHPSILYVDGVQMAARTEVTSRLRDDHEWVNSAKKSAIIRATAASLKLFHVLDLLRLMDELRKQSRLPADAPHIFPVIVAAILHPFALAWNCNSQEGAHKQAYHLQKHDTQFRDVAEAFYRRWYPEGPQRIRPIPVPQYSYSIERSGPGSTLPRISPLGGGPYFYFEEEFLRPQLERLPSGQPQVITRTVEEFSAAILHKREPLDAHARVIEFERWGKRGGFQHQLVILHCVLDNLRDQMLPQPVSETASINSGASFHHLGPLEFWLLVERGADKQKQRSLRQVSTSVFEAKDKVSIALEREAFKVGESSGFRELSQISYPKSANQLTVRDVANILKIFSQFSVRYVLLTENCYYLASLLEELIGTTNNGSSPRKGWARYVPTSTRARVLRLWRKSSSAGQCTQELGPDVLGEVLDLEGDELLHMEALTPIPTYSTAIPPLPSPSISQSPAEDDSPMVLRLTETPAGASPGNNIVPAPPIPSSSLLAQTLAAQKPSNIFPVPLSSTKGYQSEPDADEKSATVSPPPPPPPPPFHSSTPRANARPISIPSGQSSPYTLSPVDSTSVGSSSITSASPLSRGSTPSSSSPSNRRSFSGWFRHRFSPH